MQIKAHIAQLQTIVVAKLKIIELKMQHKNSNIRQNNKSYFNKLNVQF